VPQSGEEGLAIRSSPLIVSLGTIFSRLVSFTHYRLIAIIIRLDREIYQAKSNINNEFRKDILDSNRSS